jgi:Ca2+-binding RTX toxin-like protein
VNLAAVTSGSVGFTFTNTGKAASFTGSSFADSLTGGTGNDTLNGGGGMDTLTGGSGNDSMTGGAAANRFVLQGSDTVTDFNSTQSDVVVTVGLAAKDIVAFTAVTGSLDFSGSTTTAAFRATAVAAGASIVGGGGVDTLSGGNGSDSLSGGLGNDSINAGVGADTVTGGRGADILIGGTGSDTFVFSEGDTGQATGTDTMLDFAKGAVNTGDRIDYAVDLVIGGSSGTATINEALINQTTGIATFAAKSGATLLDALADIAARFTKAGNAAGEIALFRVGGKGNHYLFISDGAAGVTANDVVIQLVGVTSVVSIDLTGGDLTITG